MGISWPSLSSAEVFHRDKHLVLCTVEDVVRTCSKAQFKWITGSPRSSTHSLRSCVHLHIPAPSTGSLTELEPLHYVAHSGFNERMTDSADGVSFLEFYVCTKGWADVKRSVGSRSVHQMGIRKATQVWLSCRNTFRGWKGNAGSLLICSYYLGTFHPQRVSVFLRSLYQTGAGRWSAPPSIWRLSFHSQCPIEPYSVGIIHQ